MTPEVVIDIGKDAIMVVIMLISPILLPGLAVGLVIAMLQAATQIQEMTLSFIPKLFAVFLALILAGHWMMDVLVEFTTRLYDQIPAIIG